MIKCHTAILGGGASGISAAIGAARSGKDAVIFEKMPRIGKKILLSGNGRCNLSNDILDPSCFNNSASELVASVLEKFGGKFISSLFEDIGLVLCARDGRVFPATNQSSSVLSVLEAELKRLSVKTETSFNVSNIGRSGNSFIIKSKDGKSAEAESIVLSCGGKCYPASGSDGSGYDLAKQFGHSIVDPVPVCVPLVTKNRLCHILQGQRVSATTRAIIDGNTGTQSSGDLLFTKYGLSGTSVLDTSEEISIAINRLKKKVVTLSVDLVPFMAHDLLVRVLSKRINSGWSYRMITMGILPDKFSPALERLLKSMDPGAISSGLKDMRFNILETRGWNEAEFTSGGIPVNEIDHSSLESRKIKGLHFAGEIIDVNGKRGGYNLAWAWASGFLAGSSA